jgi:hypothetical protein
MITLTTAGSGTRLRLNPSIIRWYAAWFGQNVTSVAIDGHEFHVIETPEQIDQLIASAKGKHL